MLMTPELANLLADLDHAVKAFEAVDAARDEARDLYIALAVAALRGGVEPGEVYRRVPLTSTQMRAIAREHGIPPGRPGIKTPKKKPARHRNS